MSDWTKAARERAAGATSGPWYAERRPAHGAWAVASTPLSPLRIANVTRSENDANFIAAARADLPRALDVIEAADALVAAVPGLDGLHDHLPGGECHSGCPVSAFTRALAVYREERR